MLWLVVYDIADTKRLRKIATICEKYGVRLQKSQFQVESESGMMNDFITELSKVIKKREDSIIAYPVCADCRRGCIAVGPNQLFDPEECIIL